MMTVLIPHHYPMINPAKRMRRNATMVMAGQCDKPPQRDALTSYLNGVSPYKAVEKEEERQMKKEKKEKKDRDRERKREKKAVAKARKRELMNDSQPNATPQASTSAIAIPQPATSSFWRARPAIHIATMQRSVSITPPPTSPTLLPSTPASTPGPSNSSSTSRTSSKRPHTPDDYEDFGSEHRSMGPSSPHTQPRKKRIAVKKGWKGWVEGSPPPSEKLINLDAVPVLQERRTRSGKNFDAIGVGKDGWV